MTTQSERKVRFDRIVVDLMEFDEAFYNFVSVGNCIFTNSIPTAAISLNKEGVAMNLLWNPDFFDNHSDYYNSFIMCHEMMHIFLKHGPRGMKLENSRKANVTMDISVNHLLVDSFGFSRCEIEEWEELCWRDTVFNAVIPPQPTFEGYYVIDDSFFVPGFRSIDDHNFVDDTKAEEGETQGLPDEIKKIFEDFSATVSSKASGHGEEAGYIESLVSVLNVPKKPKFENLIKKLVASVVERKSKKNYCWTSIDRRYNDSCPEIPSIKKVDEVRSNSKYRCFFFLDNSASCGDYLHRFCRVAESLNTDVFEVHVYSFDTRVSKVERVDGKYHVHGGGGTHFTPILKHVENAEEKPDVIFVLTDGYAERVSVKDPKKWNWFVTPNGSFSCLAEAGRTWPLEQFE